jgi:hypothetical protein
MAEAIVAFGLAAGIVQFIDFGSKILSYGYRLYKIKSGAKVLDGTQDFDLITQSLQRVARGIAEPLQQDNSTREFSQTELDLRELAKRCNEVAEELLGAMDRIEFRNKAGKWYSFRAALKSVLAEDKIEAMRQRLDKFRQEIVIHILACFR